MPVRTHQAVHGHRTRAVQERAQAALCQRARGAVSDCAQAAVQVCAETAVQEGKAQDIGNFSETGKNLQEI